MIAAVASYLLHKREYAISLDDSAQLDENLTLGKKAETIPLSIWDKIQWRDSSIRPSIISVRSR